MKSQGKKIFVGVSGGVDSSVALALLKEAGHDVTGVFLKVWSPDWLPCEWRDERRSAMRVCATLGVPFMTLDCEQEYKDTIVDYMLSEYAVGRTPNPDVFCNKHVKFGVFLDKARALGADAVATGHYARIIEGKLMEAVDTEKDQSYFLHQLSGEQLAHALFPIGDLRKSEVRELARKFALPTAEKKDSQGLCFIGKVDMKEFLSHYLGDLPSAQPGDVLDQAGAVIGRHDGALFYTIGERHGFDIFKKSDHDPRMFVVAKNMEKNTVTVGEVKKVIDNGDGEADSNSQSQTFQIRDMHWIGGNEPDLSKEYGIRFRYRQEQQMCRVVKKNDAAAGENSYEIISPVPQIVASGQLAVVYDGHMCLGGGVIE